uniref:Uncharacterized protein n=1 Tax=Nothobranchius kadleci TaxID=1051664 RepID=A0A1A8DDN1_NOTKA
MIKSAASGQSYSQSKGAAALAGNTNKQSSQPPPPAALMGHQGVPRPA